LLDTLSRMDPQRPVYVEAESKRIGQVQLPDTLFEKMNHSPWLSVNASLPARVEFLLRDYVYLFDDPQLTAHLDRLKPNCGQERVDRWKVLVAQKDFSTLVSELLTEHYDHFYKRSMRQAQSAEDATRVFTADDLSPDSVNLLAKAIVHNQLQRT
jgi:tRNA 2-selenouridine synthase